MNRLNSAKITGVVFALVIFLLVANILYLGITGKNFISGKDIREYASNRGKKSEIDYATRGEIFTSDNEVIAKSVKTFKITLVTSDERKGKNAYVKNADLTAEKLAPIIGMDENDLRTKIKNSMENPNSYQIELGTYGNNLTLEQKNKIEKENLPGVVIEENNSRNYPFGDFSSYIVGYAKTDTSESTEGKIVGEMGIESNYNDELSGEDGYKLYETTADGYIRADGILEKKDAVDGKDIYLTLDSSLQRDLDYMLSKEATEAGANNASCVVMEAKTGKILAVSTYPSFDPNERDVKSYKNFFFDTAYECGSVFKSFVYASSIESGLYDGDALYQSGKYDYGASRPIRDHNNGAGWGSISYDEGFYRSSNVAICNLLESGFTKKNEVIQTYEDLGFFKADKVDGFSTAKGVAVYEKDSSRAAYLTTGFGQGSTVTMYQLIRAYSAFANDGKMVEPYVVDRIVDNENNEVTYNAKTEYSKKIFSSSTVSQVRDLLLGVVNDSTGTAKKFALNNGVQIIGKTGTGQMVDESGSYSTTDYTKSFIGMAPYDDPQIITLVVFQGPDNNTTDHQANIIKSIVPSALSVVSTYDNGDDEVKTSSYKLDSFINQSANFVKSKLEAKNLNVQVIGNGTTVIEQFPKAQTKVTENERVFIKTEASDIALPDLTGWSQKDVSIYASLAGLTINVESGGSFVVTQSIPPGTIVHSGDTIMVTLR